MKQLPPKEVYNAQADPRKRHHDVKDHLNLLTTTATIKMIKIVIIAIVMTRFVAILDKKISSVYTL